MRRWKALLVRGSSVTPCLAFCQRYPILDKWKEMGEQIDGCCPLIAYNHNAGYSFPLSYLVFQGGFSEIEGESMAPTMCQKFELLQLQFE